MNNTSEQLPKPLEPAVSSRRSISLVWIVPILAALIGLSMLAHTILSEGPKITINFRTATGLEAGKTPVKYKDVTVGAVSAIALSEDSSHVVVSVSLLKSAASLTREDTRFWVVRPRIGASGVSGVDTLLSGAYIAVDAGNAEESSQSFTGLETPPTVIGGTPGKSFILQTKDLGSLDINSPIYYRRIPVGRVSSYKLSEDGKHVDVQIFIDAPYDRFVTKDSRFWNASGMDISLGTDGLKLKTQSVAAIVAGGIAFVTPAFSQSEQAPEFTTYTLVADQSSALAPPDGPAEYFQLSFEQSLRGLAIGAPVQLAGMDLGKVVSINLDYDEDNHRFPTQVGIVVYPQRLKPLQNNQLLFAGDTQRTAEVLQNLVEHGLRAQARMGNLLTGQLYIALDFVPNAAKVDFDVLARPITIPTVSGSFDQMQEQITNIVSKVDQIPLDSIGRNLDIALSNFNKTLNQINTQILPETTQTIKQARQTLGSAQNMLADDAPLQQNLGLTLQEIQRVARSVRTLTDMLGRFPESLLRGRPNDPPLKPSSQELLQ